MNKTRARTLSRLLAACGSWLVGTLLLALPCQAQQPATPPTAKALPALLQQQVRVVMPHASLEAMLAFLRREYKLNFAVDGKPLTEQQDFDFYGALSELLEQISTAFDCKWTLTKSNVILLNKRFHKQQDKPQIHIAEIKQVATDMMNALEVVNPHADPAELGDVLFSVLRRIKPEQLQQLRSGKRIPVTELPPDAYQSAKTAMWNAGFAFTCRSWEGLLNLLNVLPNTYLEADNYQNASEYFISLVEKGKRFGFTHPFVLTYTKVHSPVYPEN